MNSTANGITEVINAIRGLTGVGICYYDLNSFFQYDKYGVKTIEDIIVNSASKHVCSRVGVKDAIKVTK
jgi:hypothetical protein